MKAGEATAVDKKVEEFEDRWKKIDALIASNPDMANRVSEPPEGSFTPEDYAKHTNLSLSHARRLMFELERDGKIKRVRFRNRFYYLQPK